MNKWVSALGVVAAVCAAIAMQVGALDAKIGAWVSLAGVVAAAAGGAIVKYQGQGSWQTGTGIIVGVAGVLSSSQGPIPSKASAIISIIGAAFAAFGKSLFNWEGNGQNSSQNQYISASRMLGLLVVLSFVFGVGAVGCAKKLPNETPAETRARKAAVYSAQVVTGFRAWSDSVEVLLTGGVLSKDAAKVNFDINEKGLKAFDIVTDRLKAGYPPDLIGKIESTLDDIDKAEAASLLGLKNEQAKSTYKQTLFGLRFSLRSLKAVIEATKEPEPSEVRQLARRAVSVQSDQDGGWWTDLVLVIQSAAIKMLEQSRMTATQAWESAKTLSDALHADNTARLQS